VESDDKNTLFLFRKDAMSATICAICRKKQKNLHRVTQRTTEVHRETINPELVKGLNFFSFS